MFEQLMDFVRQQTQESVVQNPEVPNEHNEAVMQEAASSVQTGIQQIYQQQGASGVKQLFQSAEEGRTDAPQVQHLNSNFADNITSKLGIPKGAAMGIAMAVIPMLLRNMMKRGGNQSGGFDLGSILGSVLGGGKSQAAPNNPHSTGGGILGNLGASLGLDRDGDGDTDLNDLMAMFGKK